MAVLGYARVSTCGQVLDIQELQLRAAGCTKIYAERLSGADNQRPLLKKLLVALRPGDVVVFAALDRLTRGGPYQTLKVLEQITSRGARYKSLAEPWADTTTEFGEVMAALVGFIGRKTREDIIRRTSAGRERAKALGVKFGRKPKLSPKECSELLRLCAAGEDPKVVALAYQISLTTLNRLRKANTISA